jgi:hypothetical protein
VNLGVNQTLTLEFTVQFTGFDTGAAPGANTFVAGLLRSVANPDATSGTGFTPTGPPNTNARVSGDFGSNNPPSNVFNNYGGYAAMTYTGSVFTTPIRLYARTGVSASLLNSTGPFTQFTGAAPTPSTEAMVANTDYRGTLTLQNTGSQLHAEERDHKQRGDDVFRFTGGGFLHAVRHSRFLSEQGLRQRQLQLHHQGGGRLARWW